MSYLVLGRKIGQVITIGDDIKVIVKWTHEGRQQVSFRVKAPKHVNLKPDRKIVDTSSQSPEASTHHRHKKRRR